MMNQPEHDVGDASGKATGGVAQPVFEFHAWIAECEQAGVYDSGRPVFNYREEPKFLVALTRAEILMLAQRHLNTVLGWNEFLAWNGNLGDFDYELNLGVGIHQLRFHELSRQLPQADQKRFGRQIEIRQGYITAVEAEVVRAGEQEELFQKRREAGLASDSEVAAHVTPPYMLGSPVMPPLVKGQTEPEEWDLVAGARAFYEELHWAAAVEGGEETRAEG